MNSFVVVIAIFCLATSIGLVAYEAGQNSLDPLLREQRARISALERDRENLLDELDAVVDAIDTAKLRHPSVRLRAVEASDA